MLVVGLSLCLCPRKLELAGTGGLWEATPGLRDWSPPRVRTFEHSWRARKSLLTMAGNRESVRFGPHLVAWSIRDVTLTIEPEPLAVGVEDDH